MIGIIYKKLLKPLYFKMDPEFIHDKMVAMGEKLGQTSSGKKAISILFKYENSVLEQDLFGIHFKNPIGLAAGFDKNIQLTQILPDVGFGFAEVGSITGEPCEGNPKPRLWRHPELKSLRVFYGLKNDGCVALAEKTRKLKLEIPLGISIAKTNSSDTVEKQAAINDYVKGYKEFSDIGSYDTINISCPNAYGGQPFTNPQDLDELLGALNAVRNHKPMFIKFSPDLSRGELHALCEVAKKHKVNGVICSNLTKKHDFGQGGLSGKAVYNLAFNQLKHVRSAFGNEFILIACGGIFNADDAYSAIRSGASLIQLITGMIYEGPQLIGEINKGLAKRLKDNGYSKISDAIGVDA
ncbi:MAG: quinone-dependent dihydroorotate dehydrogenase [Patescibacteria group bacterium]